jgi:hypothetical protein
MPFGIYGEVWLWGTTIEHEQGWRAQHAYPKNFILPLQMVPFGMSRTELWLTYLAAYGCDLFVTHKEQTLPLWFSQAGYQAEGVDLLAQRSKNWYARRREERLIKPGDRLAVLGQGIAVVELADRDQVYAVLWSRARVRVGRRRIRWDEQNMRWEAAVVAGKASIVEAE